MFKKQYHCLIAGLPDIIIDGNKNLVSLKEFKEDLQIYLSPEDYKIAENLFYEYDNQNILSLLGKDKNAKWDENGNYSKAYLEEQMKSPDGIVSFLFDFFNENIEKEEEDSLLVKELSLTEKYFDYLSSLSNKFLRDWFEFEMNLINLNTALLHRKYHLPLDGQIVGNNEVSQQILTSQSKDYELGNLIKGLDTLISMYENSSVLDREMLLDQMRWDYLAEKTLFEYFTIEKVLSFIIMFKIAVRWNSLESVQGEKFLKELIDGLTSKYEVPNEFNN